MGVNICRAFKVWSKLPLSLTVDSLVKAVLVWPTGGETGRFIHIDPNTIKFHSLTLAIEIVVKNFDLISPPVICLWFEEIGENNLIFLIRSQVRFFLKIVRGKIEIKSNFTVWLISSTIISCNFQIVNYILIFSRVKIDNLQLGLRLTSWIRDKIFSRF